MWDWRKMIINGYESAAQLVELANGSWEKLGDEERMVLEKQVSKFKLSPRQREGMFKATNDIKWLDIIPPKSLSFCLLMAEELPSGNENRDIAIEYAMHMLPIETFEGHTKWRFLRGLVFLFKLCNEKKLWDAIVRLSCSFDTAIFVYQETQKEEALEILLSFCKTKKGKRWKRIETIVNPRHWEYMKNVQLI